MKENKKDIFKSLKIKGTGFTSPENYLGNFEVDFLENKSQFPNKSAGYITPKNYFKAFDDKVLAANKSLKVIQIKNQKTIKIISLMAAATLMLFFSLYNFKSNNNRLNMDNIEVSEMQNWINNDFVRYNTYEISEIFTDNDLDLAETALDENLNYFDFTEIENLILEN